MQITNEIRSALRMAIKNSGGQVCFEQKTGIGQTILSRYLSREILAIRKRSWAILLPHLVPYLQNPKHYRSVIPSQQKLSGIDDTIIDAINSAVQATGGQSDFAQLVGTSRQNICKYLSGKVKKIRKESWNELLPHIIQYLPDQYIDRLPRTPHSNSGKAKNGDSQARIANALESIAQSLELIANPAFVLDVPSRTRNKQ